MKKALALLLGVILVLSLAACGGTSSTASTAESKTETKAEAKSADAPKAESTKEAEKSVLPVEIKEFGYSLSGDYLYYSVHLYNPNESYIINYPSFRVTARDASGVPLGTEEQTLMQLYPKHDAWHAFMAFSVEEEPDKVEIEMLPTADYNIKKVSTAEHTEFKPLEVINTAIRADSFGSKLVGEIKNDNDYEIKTAVVSVVFRDANGELIGGESTFVDNVPAGGTAPFDKSLYIKFVTDNYEVYADNWS